MVFTENDYVNEGFSGIGKILSTESFEGYLGKGTNLIEGGRYRPLSLVSFAIEKQLFGQKQAISHFINILLYLICGLLIFRVLSLFNLDTDKKWWFSFSFIATLLFIFHPIHSEVVANVKGRDEIMTFIGGLAAFYYSFKYFDTEKWIYLLLSGIVFFLGIMSKETVLTFIGVIPITLYFFRKTNWKKIFISSIPLFIATITYLVIRYSIIGYFISPGGKEITDIMNNPFYGMTMGERFATIFYTLGVYVKLLFYPVELTHDYYPYHIPIMNWGKWQSIISLAGYILMGLVGLWGLKKKNIFAYAILFYLLTLFITSNIPFSIGTFMNERFIFVSSLGFTMAIAYFTTHSLFQKQKSYVSYGIIGVFLVFFGIKTLLRVPAWQDEFHLNEAAIKVSKNSARANTFYAAALYKKYQKMPSGPEKEAVFQKFSYHIEKALKIHPKYGSALMMYPGVLTEQYKRDNDLPKLLDKFYEILKMRPNDTYIEQYLNYLNNRNVSKADLINFYYKIGNYFKDVNQKALAQKFYKMGLTIAPNNSQLKGQLGNL